MADAGARTGRLDSIQRLRGIAAVLVVFAHTIDLVEARSPTLGRSYIASAGHLENFGAIGVDLFFIISGFVMALSTDTLSGWRDSGAFIRLRWIRIAPPYLIVSAALLVFDLLARKGAPSIASISNALLFVPVLDTTRYAPPALTVGWTLSFEFTFYLLIAALVALVKRRRALLALGILVVVSAAGAVIRPDVFILSWLTNPIYLEFALGIGAYLLWRNGLLGRFRSIWIALGFAGVAALVLELVVGFGSVSEAQYVVSGQLSLQRAALWGLPVFAVFLAVVPVSVSGARLHGRVLKLLGDASFSIYLAHIPVIMCMNLLLKTIPITPPADLVLVLGVVVASLAGLPYYVFVERPVTERLRRRLARRAHTLPHLTPEQPLSTEGEGLSHP